MLIIFRINDIQKDFMAIPQSPSDILVGVEVPDEGKYWIKDGILSPFGLQYVFAALGVESKALSASLEVADRSKGQEKDDNWGEWDVPSQSSSVSLGPGWEDDEAASDVFDDDWGNI